MVLSPRKKNILFFIKYVTMAKKQEWRPKDRRKKANSKPTSTKSSSSNTPKASPSTKKPSTKATKSKKGTPASKKAKRKKIIKRLAIAALVLFISGILGVAGLFAYYSKDLPSPDKINQRKVAQSSKIWDRDHKEVLYELHGEEKRTIVDIENISPYLKNATLAAEDQQFYNHFGFNPATITASFLRNFGADSRAGGSTITQQFIKNSLLTSEKTYSRKIKELILAIELEAKFEKDEILEMYLNEIPYGSNAYGAEAASQTFFSKSAKDLTLAEAATLASLPKAPTFYSPYGSNTDRLEERKNWVIGQMLDNDYITQEEHDAAVAEEISFKVPDAGIIAAHFVEYVKQILEEKYSEELIKEGGFEIVTTLDLDLQRQAEKVVEEGVEKNKQYGATNAALVAVDPTSGHILAMQGSRSYFDYENDGNVNVALRNRQPGSSFKPFAYAKAFEKGYGTETILFDVPTNFGNNYEPKNYDLSTKGPLTMRDALQGSLNIPAVKTLYLAGLDQTIDFAEKLGITTLGDRSRFGLSLVLGGGEVKLLEETAAYGVFSNNGKKLPTTPILRIADKEGNIVEDNTNQQADQVMDENAAKMISSVLSDNTARSRMIGRLGNVLTVPDVQAAAKTGTTENFRDAWTVGYTKNIAVGVWAGNNDGSLMKRDSAGIYVAAPMWQKFMIEATKNREKIAFDAPDQSFITKPVLKGQVLPEEKVKIHKESGKLATDQTPPELVEEKTYRKVHNILYYVDKDNPGGPAPSNPAQDEQYERWESAVRTWAEKQEYVLEDPPTETDDSNSTENQPSITINSPSDGEKITNPTVTVKVHASGPKGVKEVQFFIAGQKVATDTSAPHEATIDISGFDNGFQNITAKVVDNAGNTKDATISVNLAHDKKTPTSISLVSPTGNTGVADANFPVKIVAAVSGSLDIEKVEFFSNGTVFDRQQGTGNNTNYTSYWSKPSTPGNYEIKVAAVDSSGRGVFTKTIILTVN